MDGEAQSSDGLRVVVLGSAAGGGSPQWNCRCRVCRCVRRGAEGAEPRTQSSIALSADGRRWVLMAPERLYVPDEVARDVLQRLDSQTSLAALVGQLAGEYNAPEETIARDVRAMLGDLIDKGLVEI